MSAAASTGVEINEEGWWVMRARGDLGGRVIVDPTEKMVNGIDLALVSTKGASAAVALSREEALALSNELKRVASYAPDALDEVETIADALEAERRLAEVLVGYAGSWVAVRRHEVVASAETLAALLVMVGPENDVDGCFHVAQAGTVCL